MAKKKNKSRQKKKSEKKIKIDISDVATKLIQNEGIKLPKNKIVNLETGRVLDKKNVLKKDKGLRKKFEDKKLKGNILMSKIQPRISAQVSWTVEFLNSGNIMFQNAILTVPFEPGWKQIMKGTIRRRYGDSPIEITNIKINENPNTRLIYPDNSRQPIPLKKMKLRCVSALLIDGDDEQPWDTKNGTCVIDFLKWYYPKIFDKLDKEQQYFTDIYKWEKNFMINGLDCIEIKQFCEANSIKMLALDPQNEIIESFTPLNVSKHKPLMFKVFDNHIHPIITSSKKAKLTMKFSDNIRTFKPNPKLTNTDDNVKVELVSNKYNSFEHLVNKIDETGLAPKPHKIQLDKFGNRILSYELNSVKYIFQSERNKVMIDFLKDDYKGESIGDWVNYATKNIGLPTSKFLPHIFDTLTVKGSKNKTHRGLYNLAEYKDFEELGVDRSKYISFDINGCHSSILTNPLERWITMNYGTKWEPYQLDDEKVQPGIYYVETSDKRLFQGNGFYTNSIVREGLEFGYIDYSDIKYQLLASQTHSKDLFKDYNLYFDEKCDYNTKLKKSMMNALSGILGKTKKNTSFTHITTNYDDMVAHTLKFIEKNGLEGFKDTYQFTMPVGDKKLYFYGVMKNCNLYENNLPMYFQILDQQAIMLHRFTYQTTQGNFKQLLYRNIDGFTIEKNYDDSVYNKLSIVNKKQGQLKITDNPTEFLHIEYQDCEFSIDDENNWKELDCIKDSNDVDTYSNLLIQGKSCMTSSFAGAGKGYIIKELDKRFNLLKLTTTNMAARNIDGETIHSALRYSDKDGNFNASNVHKLKKLGFGGIVVDEVGIMNGAQLNVLLQVKQILDIPVLAFGDYKQLKCIDKHDYEHNILTKSICDYNRATLQWHPNCRLDEEMMTILQPLREEYDVDTLENVYKNFERITDKDLPMINICFTGDCRIKINKLVNQLHYKKYQHFDIPISNLQETKPNGDNYAEGFEWNGIILHKDMPIMRIHNCHTTKNYNGYKYKLDSWSKDGFVLERNGKCILENNPKTFFIHYVPAYAMTNHKIIGTTIKEPFAVHQWTMESLNKDYNFHYTMLSRAKVKGQIKLYKKHLESIETI
jgi:hypothetical protein